MAAPEVVSELPLTLDTIGGLKLYRPEVATFYNLLVYGEAGVGKTRFSATASLVESMCPVLFLDAEAGTSSIKEFSNVELAKISTYQEVQNILKELKKYRIEDFPFKTTILDSLTEMQQLGMESVMQRTVRRAKDEDKYKDPDQPDIGDWGKNLLQTKRLIRDFRDLPCNTIFTALAQVDNSRPKVPKAKPFFNGKLADLAPGFVDIVLYMYKSTKEGTNTIETKALTEATGEVIAKDRTGKLKTVLIEPTMQMVKDMINDVR